VEFSIFTPFKYKFSTFGDILLFGCLWLSVVAEWGKSGEKLSPETKKAFKCVA